ncbi:uncharacterized protein LOC119581049 [Penaeus monodon]|uniref:uncharacterized protein LOC119581049 n=1 Tax=Penaeus monodon TaxID=6687 RepID=UPI0018A6E57C|nr:uncharacterized protein LOC119581049 [Penaeus monodon]
MTLEMHRGKMHMIPRDWDPGRLPECEMLQEDEVELNVMDFVETEYKPENNDEMRITKRKLPKERKSRSKKCWGVSVEKVKDATKEMKAKNNRKKFRATQKPSSSSSQRSYTDSDLAVVCPYATCLKNLCDRVGTIQDPEPEPLPPRLFNQLQHLEVHYPYAALLKELYLSAQADSNNIPSMRPERDCQELGIFELMKTLNYKTGIKSKTSKHANTTDFETPFSTILLALFMQCKNCNSKENWTESSNKRTVDLNGIGKILQKSMTESHDEDLPLNELHSSALLHRISLSIQQKENCIVGESLQNNGDNHHTTPDQSTTESSHSEADDLDWKPSRSRKKAANGLPIQKRRKSERRKKRSQSKPCSSKRESISTLNEESVCAKQLDGKVTLEPVAPSRLLQLIIGKDQDKLSSCLEKLSARNLKVKNEKRAVVPKDHGKMNELKVKSRKIPGSKTKKYQLQHKVAAAEETKNGERNSKRGNKGSLMVAGKTQESDASGSQILLESNASEQQSLLKEYLLKPAGEEIKTENDCDMPKVETNFLFSRMLQNFKILAEANHSESISEREQETSSVTDILREMLVSGNTDGESKTDIDTHKDTKDDKSLIQSVILQCPQTNCSNKQDPVCKVECDNSVVCKIECEEDICKVEHEEDCYECQVCHLQFSSAIDLSTHQVLFHCSEDPEASSTHMLLSHSVDNLKSNALQKKLPA